MEPDSSGYLSFLCLSAPSDVLWLVFIETDTKASGPSPSTSAASLTGPSSAAAAAREAVVRSSSVCGADRQAHGAMSCCFHDGCAALLACPVPGARWCFSLPWPPQPWSRRVAELAVVTLGSPPACSSSRLQRRGSDAGSSARACACVRERRRRCDGGGNGPLSDFGARHGCPWPTCPWLCHCIRRVLAMTV